MGGSRGDDLDALYWSVMAVLVVAAWIDARRQVVPHTIVLGLMAAGLFWGSSLKAFLLMLPVAYLLWLLGWCEAGDSKLLIGLAALTGWQAFHVLLYLVFLRDLYRAAWVYLQVRPTSWSGFWAAWQATPVPLVPAFVIAWGFVPLGLAACLRLLTIN